MVFLKTSLCLVHIPLSHSIMRIKTILSGTAAGEMFYGQSNTVRGNTIFTTLNDRYDMSKNLTDKFRVFSESSVGSLPAGIGNNIGHIHIAFFHTDSIPFSPDTVSKIIDQINGIALDGGGDTESAGPCGKYTGSIIHTKDNFTVFISGV